MDATLADLTFSSSGGLDQVFQSNQSSYTASAGFLQRSVTVTAVATDSGASIEIQGNSVASGVASPAIALAEGQNVLTVVVTAEDGTTTETYTITFSRASAGSFAQQAYLKASNAEAGDRFGWRVALSGDTLVVGAEGEDSSAGGGEADNSASAAGAAYVFTRSGGVWSQQAYLKASNAEAGDLFGYSVALSGDTLVVGAQGEDSSAGGGEADNSAANAGAVYTWQ